MKRIRLMFLLWLAASPLLAAETGKGPAPARVEKPAKETDLAHLTLTAEAEKRLGITTVAVERRSVGRTRLFGGEIILPARTGNNSGSQPTVFAILPSLTPADLVRLAQSQIDADGQVEQARVQVEAARNTQARAEQLLSDKAGSARAVEEARALTVSAEVGLKTAQARRDLLGPPVLDAANQPVLWIRVPIYVGDLPRLNVAADVQVGGLSDESGSPQWTARPVTAPPSANAAASTVDLFYEVTNTNRALRLGQKVGVTIPRLGEEEGLVAPWSAVMHDIQGGTWVYENTGAQAYTRRRVQISHVAGDQVVLAGGVKPGARVVAAGAAELFGTEFGVGK